MVVKYSILANSVLHVGHGLALNHFVQTDGIAIDQTFLILNYCNKYKQKRVKGES